MTDNDNTTSDTVIDSAKSGTLPGALSASAVTEAPQGDGNIWSKPAEDGGATAVDGPDTRGVDGTTFAPETDDDQPNSDDNTDKEDAAAEHETRIQRLEDEIAFLRKMFGWPEKA